VALTISFDYTETAKQAADNKMGHFQSLNAAYEKKVWVEFSRQRLEIF
jgi:hypothetical protein